MTAGRTWYAIVALVLGCSGLAGAELQVRDKLPDCSKVPLLPLGCSYHPQADDVATLERMLLGDGNHDSALLLTALDPGRGAQDRVAA